MKYLIIVVLFFCMISAYGVHLRDGIKPKKLPPLKLNPEAFSKINWEELRSIVEKENKTVGVNPLGATEADVTSYALEVLANVDKFIIRSGLDPLQLSDEHLQIFPGSLDLSNGWLEELGTLTASDKVIARYSIATKIFDLTLPLAFDALLIDYDYHVQVILLGISGTITAKVSDLRVDLHLGFNFSDYKAFVDQIDVKNSGKIDFNFTGLGLLDWIIDLMAKALTTFFHTLILSVVNLVIYYPTQQIVDSINSIINETLHPNSTIFMMN